jgi:hypothetical protein
MSSFWNTKETITWKLHEKHSRDDTLLQGELILARYLCYGKIGFAKCIEFHGMWLTSAHYTCQQLLLF